jgi:hypothetical protein
MARASFESVVRTDCASSHRQGLASTWSVRAIGLSTSIRANGVELRHGPRADAHWQPNRRRASRPWRTAGAVVNRLSPAGPPTTSQSRSHKHGFNIGKLPMRGCTSPRWICSPRFGRFVRFSCAKGPETLLLPAVLTTCNAIWADAPVWCLLQAPRTPMHPNREEGR